MPRRIILALTLLGLGGTAGAAPGMRASSRCLVSAPVAAPFQLSAAGSVVGSLSPPIAAIAVNWASGINVGAAPASARAIAPNPAGSSPFSPLGAPAIAETVEALAGTVDQNYFDPVVAGQVAAALRQSLASNAYANATTPKELAQLLTGDMFKWTRDKHLAVAVAAEPASSPSRGAPADQDSGIRKAEILSGNIGYLDITGLPHPVVARDALAAAMRSLRGADALILDLRDNLGGSPDTAALVLSYMLDKPGLPLFEIVARSGATQQYATDAGALPGRDGKRPLYVLTSAGTFSAGEGLAFILHEQGRATVIGETTAGAANPGDIYHLNDLFDVFVPNGKVVSAVNRGNWERVGVVPDIGVPAVDALRVAYERASRGLPRRKLEASEAWHDLLQRQIKLLEDRRTRP